MYNIISNKLKINKGGVCMKPEEIEKIKKAIKYLKIARRSGHVVFHAMVNGDTLKKDVIEPLEKIVNWSINDEKQVDELTEKFKKETEGKTLKEKSERLSKIIKVGKTAGLISAIAGGIGFATYKILKNSSKNGTEK